MTCPVVIFTVAVIGLNGILAVDYSKPDEWGGLCKTGKKQSPVDIVEKDAKDKNLKLNLKDYEGKTYCASVNNIGFTAELSFSKENNDALPMIDGDGLDGQYRLALIHFRWPSEHTLNGRKFPLEAQLVHVQNKYNETKEARDKPKGLAVLSSLFMFTQNSDDGSLPIIDKILKTVPQEPKKGNKLCGIKLTDFLPKNYKDFYRYDGSRDMPSCEESIVWTVFKGHARIAKSQLKKFKELKDDKGEPIKTNSRPVQPLNDRVITHSSG